MKQLKLNPVRNPYYNHPLMSKSHTHTKSKKSERRKGKMELRREY